MRIVVSGGTGFLGRPLCAALRADGHDVIVLTRGGGAATVRWTPDGTAGAWAAVIDGADVAINLSGESIAGRRWTRAHKARIRESRILATRSIAEAIITAAKPPAILVNGSAVGMYGDRGDELVTEDAPPGRDFLSEVALAWEAEALRARQAGTRVALVRTGVVLEKDGGALVELARPIRFFVGGPIGSGQQYIPWIHRDDWIGMVRWLVTHAEATGAFNAVAPSPVTNDAFTRALARVLHRPAFLRAPEFALRLGLGEMTEPLLLASQRVVPARALAMGFTFRFPTLEEALRAIYGRV